MAALREDTQGWWQDQLEEQEPYSANAESLRRFLEDEVLPWYRLARYEVHLDRKLERMLAMLFRLQELRRALNPT